MLSQLMSFLYLHRVIALVIIALLLLILYVCFIFTLSLRQRFYHMLGLLCFSVIAFALYLQFYRYMEPCWLCYLQRGGVLLTGLVCLAAGIHNPQKFGAKIYAALVTIAAGAGAGVAIRHIYIQSLPIEEVQNCGQTVTMLLEQMPYFRALLKMLEGSAECWGQEPVLGLPLPVWTLMFFTGMIIFAWVLALLPRFNKPA